MSSRGIWSLLFAAANIPLEKLKVKDNGDVRLLRKFFDKYIRVDGEAMKIPDPINLRGTYLPILMKEGFFSIKNSFNIFWLSLSRCQNVERLGDGRVLVCSH